MWLKLIPTFVSLFNKLMKFVNDRRLMRAGANQAELEGRYQDDEAIKRANGADVDSLPISADPQNRRNKGS